MTAFIAGACGVACGAVLFFTVEHNPVQVSDSPNPELEYDEIPGEDAITVPEKMLAPGIVYCAHPAVKMCVPCVLLLEVVGDIFLS